MMLKKDMLILKNLPSIYKLLLMTKLLLGNYPDYLMKLLLMPKLDSKPYTTTTSNKLTEEMENLLILIGLLISSWKKLLPSDKLLETELKTMSTMKDLMICSPEKVMPTLKVVYGDYDRTD